MSPNKIENKTTKTPRDMHMLVRVGQVVNQLTVKGSNAC